MPFKPGKSGNEKGRNRGVPNKTTQQRREVIAKIVDTVLEDSETLIKEIKAIPDTAKKLDVLNRLLAYIQPKPADEPEEVKNNSADWYDEKVKELMKKVD